MAVYEFGSRGVAPRVASIVTDSVVVELRKYQRLGVVGMDEIKDMLSHEANKQMLGCEDDSCLAEIGGALGVDELITGSVSLIGGSSVFNARRIHLRTARVLGSYEQRLTPKDGEEYLAVVGEAMARLYPELSLRPGERSGVDDTVALALNPPPLRPWVFCATAGGALLLAALAGGATAMTALSYDAREQLIAGSIPPGEPVEAEAILAREREAETWQTAMITLGIGAGVVAAAAALETLFTDWWGYADVGAR
ncbi:MAG: hypothetical protein JXR83_17820 [Deltaproteobacteria bacterium]|nr:hypothetical protein [Deltaproteobacteria bacterium]